MSKRTAPGRCLVLPCWAVVSFVLSQVSCSAEHGITAPELVLPVLSHSASTTGSYETPLLIRLSDLRGKVVYLDFWDTACGPCRQSLPLLSAMKQRLGDDVEIFSVNLNPDPRRAEEFLADQTLTFDVVSDPSATSAARYSVRSLPTGVFIDRSGQIADVHLGFEPDDIVRIERRLVRLVAEKQDREDA